MSTELVFQPQPERAAFLKRNAAPALALTVGGPALIWAGLSLGGNTKVKLALAGIGALMMAAGVPQLSGELKRLFG